MDFIDFSHVNWADVGVYAALVLVASIIANLINKAFGASVIGSAILTAIIFSGAYLGWNYYPHGIDVGQTQVVGSTAAPAAAPALVPAAVPADAPETTPEAASEPATDTTTDSAPAPANQ